MDVRLPPDLVSADDYARHALACVSPAVRAWLEGGSGEEQTLRANRAAFASVCIYNRILRRGDAGSTRLSLFGQALRHPILLAPVAQHGLVHRDAERATAQAAQASNTVMVASTQSTLPLEDIANALSRVGWFQLYLQPQREHTRALLRRAETAGFRALMLTLDAPIQAASRAAARAGLGTALPVAGNLAPPANPARRLRHHDDSLVFQGALSDAPGWEDIVWLRGETRLPIIAKGVAHPDDAARLVALGVDAIAVSNHGGRGLDGLPASLHMLPAIRRRVGPSLPLLLDGGVRSGGDVFKAIALGANAVMIGRPQLHALAVAGAVGVAHLIRLLRDELEVTMALAGCQQVSEIGPHCLFALGNPSW